MFELSADEKAFLLYVSETYGEADFEMWVRHMEEDYPNKALLSRAIFPFPLFSCRAIGSFFVALVL